MHRISCIGVGNMAGALISGITQNGTCSPACITLFDVNEAQYAPYRDRGFLFAENTADAVEKSDIIILAVKPQVLSSVLREIKQTALSLKEKTFVSLAAGISTEVISRALGGAAVIRTMPNTPLLIGLGVTALCRGEGVCTDAFTFVESLFSARGTVCELQETQMNAIIALTSSSPAYVYLFLQAMIEASASLGISEEERRALACDAVIGSATLMKHSDKTPQELIRIVKSPGGTTERALNVFEDAHFSDIIAQAMDACTHRAEELAAMMEDSL